MLVTSTIFNNSTASNQASVAPDQGVIASGLNNGRALYQQANQSSQPDVVVNQQFNQVSQIQKTKLANEFVLSAGRDGINQLSATPEGQSALAVVYNYANSDCKKLMRDVHEEQGNTAVDYTSIGLEEAKVGNISFQSSPLHVDINRLHKDLNMIIMQLESKEQKAKALESLQKNAEPAELANALTGKNEAVGTMSPQEQRDLIKNSLKKWDSTNAPESAAALKELVKNNSSVSSIVSNEYLNYGANKLWKLEAENHGEFKNLLDSNQSNNSFLGGKLESSVDVALPPIDDRKGQSVIVSGQEGQHHTVKTHFLVNGLARANEQRQMGKSTHWIVYSGPKLDGYSDADLSKYKKLAMKAGIKFEVINEDPQKVAATINRIGAANPISTLMYTGHGTAGNWAVDYSDASNFDGVDISRLNKDSFSNKAIINFNASCNTATKPENSKEGSVLQQFRKQLGSEAIITGTKGYTDYGKKAIDTDNDLLDLNRSLKFLERMFKADRFSERVIIDKTEP
jgi:hypothetical protein